MNAKTSFRTATRVVAAAGLAAGLALAVQPAAVAAPSAPVVAVSPASALADGQQVSVTASGLTPNTVFHLGQCAFVEPGKYGCNAETGKDITSDASGKINTTFTVRSSFTAVVTADGAVWGTVDAKKIQTQVGLGSGTGEGGGQVVSFK
ncbi:macromomycin [Streptomyces solincola]|uniref:Macromomycin n=1 Tax=Streptomyces solincola TaxID=2100817 RepID=A0A2S9PZT1_9ACTN|nr:MULTISPECIES: enediyne antibiotic chromoprotein [Streptomyces]PRH79867.1 macromomycin [Streptomyces solincola]